jgi:hypothetical protein
MPNEFIIKNGLIVESGTTTVTGSVTATGGFTGSLFGTASFALSSAGGLTNFIEGFSSATQATSFLSASNAAATVNISIDPKGSGSILAAVPDGTAVGGNARGIFAIDFQLTRSLATQVASGNYSVIAGGANNSIASGHPNAFIGGGSGNSIQNGNNYEHSAIVGGQSNQINAEWSFVGGGLSNNIQFGNDYAVIAGGRSNDHANVNRSYRTICGGYANTTTENGGFIGGGESNRVGVYTTIAGGFDNDSLGQYASIIGGYQNNASANYSTIGGGQSNTVSNNYGTIAGGQSNTVSGTHAIIGGGQANIVTGAHSFIGGGQNNRVTAPYSVVVGGLLNTASVDYSFAAGRRAKASHSGSFVWADSTDADYSSNGNDTFNVRAIGGSFFTGSMTVTGSLIVAPASTVELQVTSTGVKIGNAIGDIHSVTGSLRVSGSITGSFLYVNDNIGVGTSTPGYPIEVNGSTTGISIYASDDIVAFSDAIVKGDIQVIENAIEKIKEIRGVTFIRTDKEDSKRHAGVIAQEVQKVLPEVVTTREDNGTLAVAYGNLNALLIEAIKEQQKQIEELKAEIDKLKNK